MKKKLGEILIRSGVVSATDIDAALADQSAGEPNRLGDLLVATGKISSTQLAHALAEQYDVPYVDIPPLPAAVVELVPLELQRQFRFVPLRSEGTELFIAMADLSNVEVVALLEQQWSRVVVHVAGGDEIDALHNTLSGVFKIPGPELPTVAPAITPMKTQDDLFGDLDQHAVSPIALNPPAPRPGVDELFGDLNLESARTGIRAKPPEEDVDVSVDEPEGESEPEVDVDVAAVGEQSGPVIELATNEHEPLAPPIPEGTGPVLLGEKVNTGPVIPTGEGTGPILDMLAREGTGPVVDTPFFRDSSVGDLVPPVVDVPFASSESSLARLAIPPPEPVGKAAPTPPKKDQDVSSAEHALPAWLKSDGAAPPAANNGPPTEWSGALDHLAPSRLVFGLTRALLARGIVTEEEILAALGRKR